jgi:hypothetical protein
MMIHLGNNPLLKTSVLAKINCFVKLTVGENDTMVSIAETTAVVHQIENAEFELFANFSHPIEKVNVSFLANSIHQFST